MPSIDYDEALSRATKTLSDAAGSALEAMQSREAADVHRRHGDMARYNAATDEAKVKTDAIHELDAGVMRLRTEAIESANYEIDRLRAKAEADVDPQERMADELERQRLMASRLDGETFAVQAEQMLNAGQPRRAAMFLSVAEDKGTPMLGMLKIAVEEALDEAIPERRKANTIAAELEAGLLKLDASRYRFLAAARIGVDPQTRAAGNGSQSQVASAHVNATMADFLSALSEGREYHPADDDVAQQPDIPVGRLAALEEIRSRPRNADGTLA